MAISTVQKISSIFRPGLFKGKVAIVTGGGTGIGKAITQELLHLGCKVTIASRNVERLQKASEEMRSQLHPANAANIDHIECNIRKEDQVKNMIKHTLNKFGKLDFLVNNGGGQFPSPAADISLKGWSAVIDTNLNGPFLCTREAFNQWMKDHGGSIVNITADVLKGIPGVSHTAAARAGIENLTKSLAIEWAENGVRVNCVAPGVIYSETAAANYADNLMVSHKPLIPAKRLGTPEEMSAAVCFLLSPAAAFITGDTVKVDGGQSLYSSRWEIPDHDRQPAFSWEKDQSENQPTSSTGVKSKL